MHILMVALFFASAPFWEAKAPERWTDTEIASLSHDSPWAQIVGPSPEVLVYFATAQPIEEAEAEARVRSKNPPREQDADYSYYLLENRQTQFVLATPLAPLSGPKKEDEERRMEAESVMIVGHKTYHMIGHFPPTPSDPVLRMVFPREVQATDRTVLFRLYVPGLNFPDREVEFRVKSLMYHGKLAL